MIQVVPDGVSPFLRILDDDRIVHFERQDDVITMVTLMTKDVFDS